MPAANDARLNDICFVDAQHGWAVGDRGVIWSTEDGGRQWRLQPSGVTCSLAAVCFQNEQLGWAAGGLAHPYTHTSSGVLLTTRDGGQTWTGNPKLGLPALRRLRFFDPQHGWAIGCPSAMYPSGVFVTDDGGRHWRPLPGSAATGWLAADFLDLHCGALAGRSGSLAVVSQGQIEAVRSDQFGLRSLVEMRLVPPKYGWLVGDGGTVCLTGDLGSTWRAPPGALPEAARQFDFAALAVRGPKCWVAGEPGTRVFHTADAGHTWNVFATGSAVPLRAIWFVDDQHGWAAGELGTILATGRRRTHLAAAAGRRRPGRAAWRCWPSPTRRRWNSSHVWRATKGISPSSTCWDAATSKSRPAMMSLWPTGFTRRWSAWAGAQPAWRGGFPCARPDCD